MIVERLKSSDPREVAMQLVWNCASGVCLGDPKNEMPSKPPLGFDDPYCWGARKLVRGPHCVARLAGDLLGPSGNCFRLSRWSIIVGQDVLDAIDALVEEFWVGDGNLAWSDNASALAESIRRGGAHRSNLAVLSAGNSSLGRKGL